MDNNKKGGVKKYLIWFGMFVLGFWVANTTSTPPPIVENNNQAEWQELKEIDDQAFLVSANLMSSCSEGFNAIAEGDFKKMSTISESMTTEASKFGNLTNERIQILNKIY